MERLKVYCRERMQGEAVLEENEGRVEISLVMENPGDGLYRAVLIGSHEQLALGVMEPEGGKLALRRRPYRRDVERLGKLLRVQAECSFSFRKKKVWQRTDAPAELVDSEFLRRRLTNISRAWWRREGERLFLALALEEGKPFPLEALFCLARVCVVDGCRCVVYTFDGQDGPV